VEKWKLSAGGVSPERRKQEVITFESVGKDKYRETIKVNGKPTETEPSIWDVDGTDHEFKIADGLSGSVNWQRIDDRHLRTTVNSVKGIAVSDYVVSPN